MLYLVLLTFQMTISFSSLSTNPQCYLETFYRSTRLCTADVGYLCENFHMSKYFTVINEIFLLDLGICEDFSENDKIIPTKSEINTQNGEYICIFSKYINLKLFSSKIYKFS